MTDLRELTREQHVDELRTWLTEHSTLEVAEELARLDPAQRAVAFRLLDKDRALRVFEALDTVHQTEMLEGLRDSDVRGLVDDLRADDRARILDEMPAKVANRLLERLDADERSATNLLLGYPPESAGRVMTPYYVNLRATMTPADAIAKLREKGPRRRNIRVLPVTDDQRRLLGVVDLPDLITAPADCRVGDLMRDEHHWVDVDTDQEVAARLIQEADLVALPVVDHERRLVGVITVDDAMEVLEAEETEDIQRAGGVEPLGKPYLAASVLWLARKRAVWLLVLIAAAVATVNVLDFFEGALEELTFLALFIPLLIDTGGNSGSQASTVVIRAMAVGEVRFRDLPKILWREAVVGLLLGLMLGAVGFPIVTFFFDSQLATVVSSTLVVICTWASFAGGMLPLVAKRLGLDPAVVSAPVITTLVDATGLILYFLIAGQVYGL